MTWWQLFIREMKLIFISERRRLNFIFGASLAYLVLFSLLYGTEVVNGVPLVVFDEDQSRLSRSLLQGFSDSERFHIVGQVDSQEDMERFLREKEAYAAVHIPRNFAKNTVTDMSSQVLLMVNGVNLVVISVVTTSAQEIIADFSQTTAAGLLEQAGLLPYQAVHKAVPLQLRLRVLHNPTLSYLYFFVIGLAMAAFQQGVFLPVGASLVQDYQDKTLWEKNHPLLILAGKLTPYWLLCLVSFSLTLAIAVFLFGLPLKGSLVELYLLAFAFIFSGSALASLAAYYLRSELNFTRFALVYAVPAFTLSGYTWPQASMDFISHTVAVFFPFFYFADTVREIMVAGYSPFVYRNVGILLAIGIVLFAITVVLHLRERRAGLSASPGEATQG